MNKQITMATITEDYVSFETAKLLKERGFDELCYQKYDDEGYLSFNHVGYINGDKFSEDFCALAPTHQMAMKWFLKRYNIFICVLFFEESNGFGYTIENIITKKYIATSKNSSYKEPKEAVEAAIKYCLENVI